MKQAILEHYRKYRSNGAKAKEALQGARYVVGTKESWQKEWYADHVKLEVEPDEISGLEDLCCDEDCFDSREEYERHVEDTRERADRMGVWEVVGYYRLSTDEGWEVGSSSCGYVGEDWEGFKVEFYSETLGELEKARELRDEEATLERAGLLSGCDCG